LYISHQLFIRLKCLLVHKLSVPCIQVVQVSPLLSTLINFHFILRKFTVYF
jgi:hypothetical protein